MKKLPIIVVTLGLLYFCWKILSYGCLDCGDSLKPEVVAKVFTNDTLKAAMFRLRIDVGRYPTSEEGLKLLFQEPKKEEIKLKWKGPYIDFPIMDPWKNQYQYQFPGTKNIESFDIFSFGPDGVLSDDDIGNWNE
jgi:general secretion pathway protein G